MHRFHVNPLLKNTEDAGRGARGEGGRAGRLLYSSDLGQTSQMDVNDWLEQSQRWFDTFELDNARRVQVTLANPQKMLEL
ncbi:hypothetical protein GIW71_30060 [Pseudomonas lactis]|uniref:Uncharacterized protein n=1 Tax=Pseudomonas lactis TaxID=1615674 RepID=A0ABS9FPJ5_9PSED|nr:hypothetical protein [Pseudomonas lactis]MCF5365626.1 hypothetical protein [Pseudomonas sp. PA-4-8C]MCF5001898.1 hypothetical protein [Pseudomonas lactis]MCF5008076.1 hypothetical protein [Pseudomonas lactis]MCF5013825.1 hypothetical protein [Pseudomonas lactis]